MNRPITSTRICGLFRALFLILLLSIFAFSVTRSSAQVSDVPTVSDGNWGLLPLHIDRGLPLLDLSAATRSEIDTLRWRYLGEQNRLRNSIVHFRHLMLERVRSDDRSGLDTIRRRVRSLMVQIRQETDAYGRAVAALLTPVQIATLLDPEIVWGDRPDLSPFATAPESGMSYSRSHEHGTTRAEK